jgi:xanthine dehydrogenase accessory factor
MGKKLSDLVVLIRGAGEIASGIAHTLHCAHFGVCLTDISNPLAVRREVSFCEAIYEGFKNVEGVIAKYISSSADIETVWNEGKIPLLVDPEMTLRHKLKPDILVDAIMAKRNLGTHLSDASLVIGIGPGFYAGRDVHIVIETNRGHNLGRLISQGEAEADTKVPGMVGGFSSERVLRAPVAGQFKALKNIGDEVKAKEVVASVSNNLIRTQISGIIRGLLRNDMVVNKGMKVGDIDPRGFKEYCYTISDKAKAIAGGVLEAILMRYNN